MVEFIQQIFLDSFILDDEGAVFFETWETVIH